MLNKFYLAIGIIGSLSLSACGTDPDKDVITGKPLNPPTVSPNEPSTPPVTPNEPGNGGDNNGNTGGDNNGGTGGDNNGGTGGDNNGGTGGDNNGNTPQPPVVNPDVPPTPEPGNPFPEPNSAKYDPVSTDLGFYDYDRMGNKRAQVNHLTGTFEATIQFAQNLTTAPNGNEAHWHPRPVAEREALLIVMPTDAMGDIDGLKAVITVNGTAKGEIALHSPDIQPRSDRTKQDARPDVVFSTRAWTMLLPWDWMVPGLEINLTDSKKRSGVLAAADIDFGAPGQLVINQIQLGMLTDYPGPQYMLTNPAEAASDYFQTIPAASMLLGSYDPIRLDKVMIDSGKIYTAPAHSDTSGDVYSGDMRENVGKATFSTGINLANWGISSAKLGSQSQPQLTQRAVIHHARGKYTNGDANHGLSGGNGILTLINSSGNEFSHEIGHHYGLGHYPGQNIGPGAEVDTPATSFWDRHHADSGWGYIGYRNRMHTSLYWWDDPSANWAPWQAFQKIYYYSNDAMSGGRGSSSLSNYTLYTGYSTYLKIQPAFDKVQYSCDFDTHQVTGTGFLAWNKTTRQMEEITPTLPKNNGDVWYNNGDANQTTYLKPRLCSVPVFTLLGGYDPVNKTAVMYPAARSNLGNVFNLPAPTISATERRCWVQVDFANGTQKNIAIAPNRLSANSVNRYHINLAQADKPSGAALYCQEPGQVAQQLGDAISIADPASFPAMAPAIIVGKDRGYDDLWNKEKAEFTQMLEGLASTPVPILNDRGQLLYASWVHRYRDELNFLQSSQLKRYEDLQSNMLRLNRWMFAWNKELQGNNAEADQALVDLAVKLGLAQEGSSLLPATSVMTVGYNSCLSMDITTHQVKAYGSKEPQCTDAAQLAQRSWIVDGLGRIHNGANLAMCISNTSPISMTACDIKASGQVWDFSKAPMIKNPNNNQCMDMNGGTLGNNGSKDIILYGCGSGKNQQWVNVTTAKENALLPLLHNQNLPIAQRISSQQAKD